ncbi:MAG: putative oxidoreductase [Flavobacteriaceae bacterium]
MHFGLLLLRIGFGASMLTHGYGKFTKIIGGNFSFGDPIGIGPTASLILCAFAEFIAPILLVIGWKTRWFALIAAINMFVAFIIAHDEDPFSKKEKSFLFLIAFVVLYFTGPGKYSIDRQ